MMERLKWCTINNEYLEYLKQGENRIPNYNYTTTRQDGTTKKLLKPFFAVVMENEGFSYVAQVNHPQPRHYNLREDKDFIKIFNPDNNRRLMCVVNLNYMFPVPKQDIIYFSMANIEQIRDFDNMSEKSNYINLLNKEITELNNKNITALAKNLLEYVNQNPTSYVSMRCFNFANLERKCAEWTRLQTIEKVKNNEKLPKNWEYYNSLNNELYCVLDQNQNNKNQLAVISKAALENNDYSNIGLYEVQDNNINYIHNLNIIDGEIDWMEFNQMQKAMIDTKELPNKVFNFIKENISADQLENHSFIYNDVEYDIEDIKKTHGKAQAEAVIRNCKTGDRFLEKNFAGTRPFKLNLSNKLDPNQHLASASSKHVME